MALNKKNKGFTLIELIIVVSIILLLATLAIPNIVRARDESEIARVLSELKNINTAIVMYELIESKSPNVWDDLIGYINIVALKDKYDFNLN